MDIHSARIQQLPQTDRQQRKWETDLASILPCDTCESLDGQGSQDSEHGPSTMDELAFPKPLETEHLAVRLEGRWVDAGLLIHPSPQHISSRVLCQILVQRVKLELQILRRLSERERIETVVPDQRAIQPRWSLGSWKPQWPISGWTAGGLPTRGSRFRRDLTNSLGHLPGATCNLRYNTTPVGNSKYTRSRRIQSSQFPTSCCHGRRQRRRRPSTRKQSHSHSLSPVQQSAMPVLKMRMEQTSKNHTRKYERESVAVPLHSRQRKRAIHFGRIPLADPISQPTSDRTITAQMGNQRLTYFCRYLQSEEETEHKRREKESSFLEEKLLRKRKCLGKRESVPPFACGSFKGCYGFYCWLRGELEEKTPWNWICLVELRTSYYEFLLLLSKCLMSRSCLLIGDLFLWSCWKSRLLLARSGKFSTHLQLEIKRSGSEWRRNFIWLYKLSANLASSEPFGKRTATTDVSEWIHACSFQHLILHAIWIDQECYYIWKTDSLGLWSRFVCCCRNSLSTFSKYKGIFYCQEQVIAISRLQSWQWCSSLLRRLWGSGHGSLSLQLRWKVMV